MHQRFLDFARSHGADAGTAEQWWHQVETRYADKRRRYHTLRHIEEMPDPLPHPDETVLAAVWFHDARFSTPTRTSRASSAHSAIAVLAMRALSLQSKAA